MFYGDRRLMVWLLECLGNIDIAVLLLLGSDAVSEWMKICAWWVGSNLYSLDDVSKCWTLGTRIMKKCQTENLRDTHFQRAVRLRIFSRRRWFFNG